MRDLSQRTASATEEISRIVGSLHSGMDVVVDSMDTSIKAVDEGSAAIGQMKSAMGAVSETIADVKSHSGEISITLKQQRSAANEVASGIARTAANSGHATDALETIMTMMDAAQAVLVDEIAAVSELDIPNKVLQLAQSDHVIWKRRLANMIVGREGLKPDELASHHSCRLGKWYDHVDDPCFYDNADFRELANPHRVVHHHGIEAVKAFNHGDIEEALRQIEHVETASTDVLYLLKSLERQFRERA